MNAISSRSTKAYYSHAVRSARDIEYDAFSHVTRLLLQAPRECRNAETIDAVSRNNELWTFLAVALSDPMNKLEPGIKVGLLGLAEFALRHGQLVLSGEVSTEVLIDVNRSIMKGLRGAGAA